MSTTNLSMNQLVKYTEAVDEIQDFNGDGNTWFTSMLDVKKKNHILGATVSEKELKIRSELETEVERDLEEEIKNGLCNLSLRLHRLYQRQKERQMKEASSEVDINTTTKALAQVNIRIKMEGKTKVEIKETKKEATDHQKGHRRSMSQRSEDMKQQVSGLSGKKVDWEKTLRAGSGRTVSVNKANRESDKGRANIEGRRSSSGLVKRQGKVDYKLLQLGWKG